MWVVKLYFRVEFFRVKVEPIHSSGAASLHRRAGRKYGPLREVAVLQLLTLFVLASRSFTYSFSLTL